VISVVVPLLNEESSLEELYAEIASALEPRDEQFEVVFVDDGSTDASISVLSRLHDEHANVVVVRLRRNFGKAAALQAGFLEARGEVIVTIDADLQDDPAEIPQLLAKLDEGFDLVSGWKTRRNDPFLRRVFSRIFNWTNGVISGVRLHDVNCGLKAYRTEVVQGMRLYGELHRFLPVLAAYQGYRVAEIPVNHRARQHGRSRYGPERYLRGFFDLLSVTVMGRYRYRPLHLFGGIGLLMGAVGFIILLYLSMLWFWGQGIGARPLFFLGVLLEVVGIQFVSLGLLSELITSQHEERMDERQRVAGMVEDVLRS
jgi:glycosyltransferase involved in cell wall biosynthesis